MQCGRNSATNDSGLLFIIVHPTDPFNQLTKPVI